MKKLVFILSILVSTTVMAENLATNKDISVSGNIWNCTYTLSAYEADHTKTNAGSLSITGGQYANETTTSTGPHNKKNIPDGKNGFISVVPSSISTSSVQINNQNELKCPDYVEVVEKATTTDITNITVTRYMMNQLVSAPEEFESSKKLYCAYSAPPSRYKLSPIAIQNIQCPLLK